ncbi:hypothetical protein [Natronorubrum sulfidifaciens]|uniref:Uncharacterized protein n=1 Tax=Natronorubrum sulfidifaciens JCM 14089 TaxID=1230460 RepID=L9WD73_9EURY|nr:hypothetical protein [Natronorubrum sulfidifaciens]ELY47307.1 hypothetical protein C495_03577 [Natronorubrum sulfidifaciens JCM 14089]
MRLEFTDRRGVDGVVHGESWELEYDGLYYDQVEESVSMYEEVAMRVPIDEEDEVEGVKMNAHYDEPAPPERRLKMMKSRWGFNPYIAETNLVLDDD